jgi:hypothetical protein
MKNIKVSLESSGMGQPSKSIRSIMNTRNEFREAFRQYRRRLGLPLPCPTSDIRVGELCVFNVDGTVLSLGNVLDGYLENCVTRTVDFDAGPIISNGMRCRTLSQDELARYSPL